MKKAIATTAFATLALVGCSTAPESQHSDDSTVHEVSAHTPAPTPQIEKRGIGDSAQLTTTNPNTNETHEFTVTVTGMDTTNECATNSYSESSEPTEGHTYLNLALEIDATDMPNNESASIINNIGTITESGYSEPTKPAFYCEDTGNDVEGSVPGGTKGQLQSTIEIPTDAALLTISTLTMGNSAVWVIPGANAELALSNLS